MSKNKKRLALIAGILLVVALAAAALVSQFAGRTVETDKVRTLIAAKTGRKIGGPAGLLPIRARGFLAASPGLVATASPPRALSELRASGLSARFSLLELWRGKWRLDYLRVDHLQVAYGPVAAQLLQRDEFPDPEMVPPSPDESVMSVDIRELSIAQTDLYWADPAQNGGQFRDVVATFYPVGKDLRVEGHNGTFRQAKFPEARVTSFKLYYSEPVLRIDEAQLALGQDGVIKAAGDLRFEENASLDLKLEFAHCPITPFLKGSSADKIDGRFGGIAHVEKKVGAKGSLTATGNVTVDHAIVKNVAALEKAAAFTGKERLNPLRMDEVRGDYRWADGVLTVRDFRAQANQVVSVHGSFTYRQSQIDGTFELGVAPDIVAKFPGAREEVFTREESGYLWTTVQLTGPLSKPRDDLKPRLMRALQKHFLGGILEPIIKPAQAARDVLELLFPQ